MNRATVALAQGAFYALTGAWPLVSMPSFTAVTGPKADLWLVRTAGVLITGIGATLALAARRGRVTPEIAVLGVASALGLTGIDVVYASSGRISKVYLLDAAAELALVAAWAASTRSEGEA